jgi:hypothetical protein
MKRGLGPVLWQLQVLCNAVLTGCFDSKRIDRYVFIGCCVTFSREVPSGYFTVSVVPVIC